MSTVAEYRQKLYGAVGRRDQLRTQLETLITTGDQLEREGEALDKAQALLQKVAQETQQHLKFHIEDMVQAALEATFPNTYQFRVTFEIKRGQTEAALDFVRAGRPVKPMEGSGGGAVDIAAFALRLAAWSLGHTRPLIILDEPFRFLSEGLRPQAGEMLHQLSRKLGLQIIMVTHDPKIVDASDKVFKVRLEGLESQVEVMD